MSARRYSFVAVCSLFAAPAICQQGGQLTSVVARTPAESWLAVSINSLPARDVALFIRDGEGRVFCTRGTFESWRIRVPPLPAMTYNGEEYFALDALAGLSYHVDEDQQLLSIQAPAHLFNRVTVEASSEHFTPPAPPPMGAFLNYDVVATDTNGGAALSGLVEASVFGRAGAGVTRFLARQTPGQTRNVRLDSTWTLDRPESTSSIRLGDSITGASRWWGGAVRFGGIQLASNFATRPGLVTLPLPSLSGEAVVPSTLELYVNDALHAREQVPGGPFRLDEIPVVTGEGEIRLVIRDVLGREQVITSAYYASPRLLRAGLHDYSVDLGFVRENYGLTSDDYGRPLLVATDRFGVTDRFTAEMHAEVLEDQQSLGAAGALLLGRLGVVSAAMAASHSAFGEGGLVSLGFDRIGRIFGLGLNAELATSHFTRLGLRWLDSPPRLKTQVYTSIAIPGVGSLGVTHTREQQHDGSTREILSARHNFNVGSLGYFTLSALHVNALNRDTIVQLTFARSLGARTSASSTVSSSDAGISAQAQVQRNLPTGTGFGYRATAASGLNAGGSSTLQLQNGVGTYELEAIRRGDAQTVRASVSGGLAALGGQLFASRRIDSSFAVAQVGDQAGVRVYRENQLVGRTNRNGHLLLPGLRAYDQNTIRVEQADLPLDAEFDSLEAQAIPWFRSGVLLPFRVERPHAALVTLVLENGELLPTGVLVRVNDGQEAFPSGLRGEVYVTGLASANRLTAEWGGRQCHVEVPFSSSEEPLPHLGRFTCREGRASR